MKATPYDQPHLAGSVIALPTSSTQAAGQAMTDTLTLAGMVRDHDPAVVWRTIEKWEPTRIITALIAAVAAIDPLTTPRDMWGWTQQERTPTNG